MSIIDENTINRNTPFADVPVGAVVIVMSVGKLVQVKKMPIRKNGSHCSNARKTHGRRGLTFIWPDVLAHVVSLSTEQETAAIIDHYNSLDNGKRQPWAVQAGV